MSKKKKAILSALEQGLLHGAAMSTELCEEVLMDVVAELEASLREDGDDALIALVAEEGEMALLLLDKGGVLYRNEAAREQLKQMWRQF